VLTSSESVIVSSEKASIGVDYSGSVAYLGVVKNDRVLATSTINLGDSPYTFFHTIKAWLKTIYEEHDTNPELWIEQPFVVGTRFPQVALKLVRTATILELAALEAGIEPCFVHPGTWRKKVYGNGRPDDLKQRARDTAKKLFSFETKYKNQHNICEGLLIAHYGQIHD
jgi:hypothetical protein